MPNFNQFVKDKNKAMLENFGRFDLEDINGYEIYQEVEKLFKQSSEEEVRAAINEQKRFLDLVSANEQDYVRALAGKKQDTFNDMATDPEVVRLEGLIDELKQKVSQNDSLLNQNQRDDNNISVYDKEPSNEVKNLRNKITLANNKINSAQDALKQTEDKLTSAQKEKEKQERVLKDRINEMEVNALNYESQLRLLQQKSREAREKIATIEDSIKVFNEDKDYNKANHDRDAYYKNATEAYDKALREAERDANLLDEQANEIIQKLEKNNADLEVAKEIHEFAIDKDISNIKVEIEEAKKAIVQATEEAKAAKEAEVNQLDKEENERLKRLETVQKCLLEGDRLDKEISDYNYAQLQIARAKLDADRKKVGDLNVHDQVKETLNKEPLRTNKTIGSGAKALKEVYDRFKQEHNFFARWFKGFKKLPVGRDYDLFSKMRDNFIAASGISINDINDYLDGKAIKKKLKYAIDSVAEKVEKKPDELEKVQIEVDLKEDKVEIKNELNQEREKEIDAPINQKIK